MSNCSVTLKRSVSSAELVINSISFLLQTILCYCSVKETKVDENEKISVLIHFLRDYSTNTLLSAVKVLLSVGEKVEVLWLKIISKVIKVFDRIVGFIWSYLNYASNYTRMRKIAKYIVFYLFLCSNICLCEDDNDYFRNLLNSTDRSATLGRSIKLHAEDFSNYFRASGLSGGSNTITILANENKSINLFSSLDGKKFIYINFIIETSSHINGDGIIKLMNNCEFNNINVKINGKLVIDSNNDKGGIFCNEIIDSVVSYSNFVFDEIEVNNNKENANFGFMFGSIQFAVSYKYLFQVYVMGNTVKINNNKSSSFGLIAGLGFGKVDIDRCYVLVKTDISVTSSKNDDDNIGFVVGYSDNIEIQESVVDVHVGEINNFGGFIGKENTTSDIGTSTVRLYLNNIFDVNTKFGLFSYECNGDINIDKCYVDIINEININNRILEDTNITVKEIFLYRGSKTVIDSFMTVSDDSIVNDENNTISLFTTYCIPDSTHDALLQSLGGIYRRIDISFISYGSMPMYYNGKYYEESNYYEGNEYLKCPYIFNDLTTERIEFKNTEYKPFTFYLELASYKQYPEDEPLIYPAIAIPIYDERYFTVEPSMIFLSPLYLVTVYPKDVNENITSELSFEVKSQDKYLSGLNVQPITLSIIFDGISPPSLISCRLKDDDYIMELKFNKPCIMKGVEINKPFKMNKTEFITFDTNPSDVDIDVLYYLWIDNTTLYIYYNNTDYSPDSYDKITIQEGYIFSDLNSINSTHNTVGIEGRTAVPDVWGGYFIDENTITIQFDIDIKDGIDIYGRKCNEIFVGDSFNPLSMCYLSSPDTITMKLVNPSKITPNEYLNFIPNVIKSSKNHVKGVEGETMITVDPSMFFTQIVISVNKLVSSCYDFIIDGSKSYGSKRPYTYHWSSTDSTLEGIVSAIKDPFIIIPKNTLEADKDYNIALTVKNDFGESEGWPEYFRVVSHSFLDVKIEGYFSHYLLTSQKLYVRGRVSLYQCDKSLPKPEIEYNWSIEDDNSEAVDVELYQVVDETRLFFDSYSTKSKSYSIKLTSSLNGTEYKDEFTISTDISDYDILETNPGYLTQNLSESIIIDVSTMNNDPSITYAWKCTFNKYDYCGYLITDSASPRIEIPGDRLEIGIYELQVNITRNGNKVSKTFTREIKEIPFSLNIQNPKSNSTIFKQKDMFQLVGISSIGNDEMEYKWIYTNSEEVNPFIGKTDYYKVNVNCENLNPKITHIIKLIGTYRSTKVESLFQFTINEGPYNGYLYSSTLDYKFGDNIILSTVGWYGEGEFTYRFGVIINNSTYYLQAVFGLANYYYGPLPLGSFQFNYTLIPIVFVKDKYGVISNTSLDKDGNIMEIYSPPLEIDNLLNITDELKDRIDDLKNEKYYDYMYPIIEGISSHMKEKDCSYIDCKNDAVCLDGHCQCLDGFYGDLCENRIPIDGGLSENYTYGECDHKCGKGLRPKWKECNNPIPEYGGKECEIVIEYEECIGEDGVDNCEKENGNWTEWSEWSECSSVCEVYNGRRKYGIRTRNRNCTSPKPSGNGLNCVGNSIETEECYVICESVRKLCPGEYLTKNKTIVGNACSGNGNCTVSREGCKEYEPNCHSKCECREGFKGEKCEYTTSEYEARLDLNKILLANIIEASSKNVLTYDSIDQQSSVLLSVINPPDQLTAENKSSTISFIRSSISSLKENYTFEFSRDSITNYIKSASLLLKDEWKDRKEDTSRMLQQSDIGKEIPEIFYDITEMHLKQDKSILPLQIETNAFSLKAIKCDGTIDFEGYVEESIQFPDLIVNSTKDDDTDEISVIDWLDNPNDDDLESNNRTAGVTSISIMDKDGEEKKIENLEKPIYFLQRLNDNTNLKNVQCSYYVDGELKSNGLVVMGIIDDDNGNKYVLCAATHLSDFSTRKKSILPKMNFVNPIDDAMLLVNYNKDNMIVPIVLGSVVGICVIAWLVTKIKDVKEVSLVEEHKSNYFRKTGRLDDKETDCIMIEKERKNICQKYWDSLVDEHSWISPQLGAAENLIVLNRSQRILSLTAQVLTSTGVNALFFGNDAENISQLAMTSIISTLCMLPAAILIPYIYKFANGYSSKKSARKAVSTFVVFFNKLKRSMNTLKKKKTRLYLTLLAFVLDGLTACFFIAFIVILPPGYITLLLFCVYILFIIETVSTIIITNEKKRKFFILLVLLNIIIFAVFVTLLVVYVLYMNDSSTAYSIWKSFYNAGALKDINEYIENSLECCGYNAISDYNTTDCSAPKIMALGISVIGCESLLVDKFKQYAPLWIIYFAISSLLVLMKIICLVRLMAANINVVEVNLEFEELNKKYKDDIIAKEKIEKIKCILKHRVTRVYYKRKIEYLHWKRQRRIRAGLIILANSFVFLYILIMVYINLLYGVKFSSDQAKQWILSSTISMIIDVVIQEPAMILLSTVAVTTIGSLF